MINNSRNYIYINKFYFTNYYLLFLVNYATQVAINYAQ